MTHKYVGDNTFQYRAGEQPLEPGDTVEFADGPPEHFAEDFEEVPSDESDAGESSSGGGEDVSPSDDEESAQEGDESRETDILDVGEYTVSEFEAELSAQDFTDEELELMDEKESDGEDRTGIHDAIASEKEE